MKKSIIATLILTVAASLATAQTFEGEKMSRGFAGIATDNGIHLSWRALPDDKSGMAFDIYRVTGNGKEEKLNKKPIKTTSDFTDTGADKNADNRWILKSGGKELASFSIEGGKALPYINIPISKPAPRTIYRVTTSAFGSSDSGAPASDNYTYTANDCSVGDLDGDGELEIILKWDVSNTSTPERTGVTGNTLLDAYKMDGTQLWRIDLGHNVRSTYASIPFVIYDINGDGKAELICKTGDGTVDGEGTIIGNPRADWRSMDEASPTYGRTVVGLEYLTVFDGTTGKAVDSQRYIPTRFPLNSWGGIGENDDVGNRSENYTAGVAYFDGQTPSVFFVRGREGRTVVAAWSFDGEKLTNDWIFDSSKPEWNGYSGNGNTSVTVGDFDRDGKDEVCVGAMIVDNDGNGLLTTKLRGGIALHAGDLIPSRKGLEVFGTHDNSGVIGAFLQGPAMAIYDGATGEVIWDKGAGEIVGRGVAADIDPRHEGAEMWVGAVDPAPTRGRGFFMPQPAPQPTTAQARPAGAPATPQAAPQPRHMPMMQPAVLPEYDGALKGVYNGTTGELISDSAPASCNFIIYWDADAQSELLDGTEISKWNWEQAATETIMKAEGVKATNGTKATPCFSGDILGDWREEVVWVDDAEENLRIYMTDIPAENRIPTLMSDRMYRLSLVWQNVGHNQPPHTSYDMVEKFAEQK
ncbi:MAG: hypothetical protein J6K90_02270 [Tidjanibacter sp.]|nr:hypothetical protein [Tidjanibacter sp.]